MTRLRFAGSEVLQTIVDGPRVLCSDGLCEFIGECRRRIIHPDFADYADLMFAPEGATCL
jgi:hypothetical protein